MKTLGRAAQAAFAVLAFVLSESAALADTTVHSLAGVRGAMHTTDARKVLDHSMGDALHPRLFR
ncbi:hypothetical protein Busp01_32660 [Trinickia caryophylli]|nr:hypothetical protein Busp01_32660 [Trinickia caryophylli]